MTTWGAVHVGDTVRGADQRAWEVVGVDGITHWINVRTGVPWDEARLTLRLDGREVSVRRPAGDPVELVARADHGEMAAACMALLDTGLSFEILEETTVTTTTADPFSAPAAPPGDVKRDRWGRYLLPDPETGAERAWTRATTVARTLADEYHLTLWKMRMVAKGMALRPDLVAGAAAADPDEDKKTLNEIADKAMERAGASAGATLGTALHTFTHRLDRGEAIPADEIPAAIRPDLVEYADTLKQYRLRTRPEWVERIVVLPALGIAGQLDRIVQQPSGVTKSKPLSVLDLKTGKSVDYMLEIAIQLAIYANAPLIWNPVARSYEPMPEVDRDRALVLHLPVGKTHGQLYGVNIIEGWEYAQLAILVREARKRDKGMGWLVDPEPEDLALHLVGKAATQADLAQLWDRFHPSGQWTQEVNAAAARRWEEINTPATATV